MSHKERLFHSILFEALALVLFVPLAMFVTQKGAAAMAGISVLLSLIAMAWNYLYNLLFDRFQGSERSSRGLWIRIAHGAGFELGLIFATIPMLMYALQESFLTVLILDLGAVMFFFVYAILFNWAYDALRPHVPRRRAAGL
jgi:uncharacterized membrane protein